MLSYIFNEWINTVNSFCNIARGKKLDKFCYFGNVLCAVLF